MAMMTPGEPHPSPIPGPHVPPPPPPAPSASGGRDGGRVLGIDPSLHCTGYAVIEATPRGALVLEGGVIRPRGLAAQTLESRLLAIHNGVLEVIDALIPASMAMEQVHSHSNHPRTGLLMAHARGVIMLAAARRGLAVTGYAPARIKKTLTGSGRAIKEQMQHAIMAELGLETLPEPHDVADACAVALCHLQMTRNWAAVRQAGG